MRTLSGVRQTIASVRLAIAASLERVAETTVSAGNKESNVPKTTQKKLEKLAAKILENNFKGDLAEKKCEAADDLARLVFSHFTPKESEKSTKKGITVTLPILLTDQGDGSAAVHIFRNMDEVERAARAEENSGNANLCDNTMQQDIVVNQEGEIISGYDDIEEFIEACGGDDEDSEDEDDDEDQD
jgi:hypothetical protein